MEEIARRRPVDRTAALVTQPGPKHLEPTKRASSPHGTQPAPWPLRPVPSGWQNATGERVGSLTVVGLSHLTSVGKHLSGGQRARWVCRCACGYYVVRSLKAVRNTGNTLDACDRCLHRQHLQHQQRRLAAGECVPTKSRLSALAPDSDLKALIP